MPTQPYTVKAFWDAEAAVWVATSETILGLVTEAATIEELAQKLRNMIPELLELNQLSQIKKVMNKISPNRPPAPNTGGV
jgi:predicted RNase H-like HicB family nuclease